MTESIIIDAIITGCLKHFRCFGGGQESPDNPLSHALKDTPAAFAAGVDVRDVIKYVLWAHAQTERPRPLDEWHEDIGDVLWWKFPITEPPYVGSPLCLGQTVQVTAETVDGMEKLIMMVGGWPGYHTHFTPIPIPEEPK